MFPWYFIAMFLNMFNDLLEYILFHDFIFLLMSSYGWYLWLHFRFVTAPWTLLCNVHRLLMIDVWRKLKDICQQIHDSLRKQKIMTVFWLELSSRTGHLSSKPSNVSHILSNKGTQQNWGITVIILKNSLPQKKTLLYHWKITVLTLMQ